MYNLLMKWIITYLFIFSAFILKTEVAQAFVYSTIIGSNTERILVQKNFLDGDKSTFDCRITTLKCTPYDKATDNTKALVTPTNVYTKKINSYKTNKDRSDFTSSASGRYLAYLYRKGDASFSNRAFVIVDLKTGKKLVKSENIYFWDQVTDEPRIFAFSPNEKTFVYVDDYDGPMMLHVVDLKNFSKLTTMTGRALISDQNFHVGDFIFKDNDNIIFTAHDKKVYDWAIWQYNLKTNVYNKLASNASFSDKLRIYGNKLVFQEINNGTKFPVVYDFATKVISNFDLMLPDKTPSVGTRVQLDIGDTHGVLITPNSDKDTGKLAIWMHGGPPRQAAWDYHSYASYAVYDWALNELVKSGVSVFKLDYIGSQGYSRKFREAIKYQIGLGDMKNITDTIDTLDAKISPKQISLMGNSYGGYMGLRYLVEYGDKVNSVLSINGVTDWRSLLIAYKNKSPFNAHFNGMSTKLNEKYYSQADILSRISNIGTQKIIIGQSTNDTTIFPWQAPLLNDKLVALKKNTKLVNYVGEDHVITNTKNLEEVCRNMFEINSVDSTNYCHFPKEK